MRLLSLAVVLCLAVAGCATKSPKASDEPEANFDQLDLKATETTGIIRGVIVDAAVRPVAEASINLTGEGAGRVTKSALDGAFGFDGLQPGTYFLTVSKKGHIAAQTSAEVVAGVSDPPIVKVLLDVDPASRPQVELYHLDGFIACSVRPMFIGLQCGFVGGVTGESDVVNADYTLPQIPDWIQSEMIWKSTQTFGEELSLAIRCLSNSERCPDGQLTIVRAEGKSPQIAAINRTTAELWALGAPDGDPLQLSIFAFGNSDYDVYDEETIDNAQEPVTGQPCLDWNGIIFPDGTCVRATGPGFMFNQKVDVYTHVFYGFVPDEEWTFINNGPPKVPT